ncbi:MAG: hypothetical protein D3911_12315 [Candidatus Electrothrix sp. AW3_4]|nr:hypothetical protein [Candidatus Electrothrix gigas]
MKFMNFDEKLNEISDQWEDWSTIFLNYPERVSGELSDIDHLTWLIYERVWTVENNIDEITCVFANVLITLFEYEHTIDFSEYNQVVLIHSITEEYLFPTNHIIEYLSARWERDLNELLFTIIHKLNGDPYIDNKYKKMEDQVKFDWK